MRRFLALTALAGALAVSALRAEPKALPPGPKAVTIRLDALKCRYVEVGDSVDVLLTYSDKNVKTTETILQDVTVLEVAPRSGEADLTLSLTKKEAEDFASALKKGGVFSVAARAPSDHEVHPMQPAEFRKLFR